MFTGFEPCRFIDAKGYTHKTFWSEAGWQWVQKQRRQQPEYWHDSGWNNPIFPVVGVSHYEAEAYCQWLSGTLAEREFMTSDGARKLAKTDTARLPTEHEWERAARGTDGREFPWGDEFDFSVSNVASEDFQGIGTTAVCTYPQGESPVGAWDMGGNVWEWAVSTDRPNSVVRGGSWLAPPRYARCAVRYHGQPASFYHGCGFRVVLSLAEFRFLKF